MAFGEYLQRDRRLVLLRILAEAPGYRANSSTMTPLLEMIGHKVSRDSVKTELSWLAEQGLVKTEEVGPVLVATLTERGQDVAEGRVSVPGIAKPRA